MSTSREKLLAQFRELVTERLAKIGRSLMTLEAGGDVDAGKAALRELHGLKGEARMMGFAEVNAVVHEMEELVRCVEPAQFALSAGSVDALLGASDGVALLSGAAQGTPPDVQGLHAWLQRATAAERERLGGPAPEAAAAPPPSAPAPTPSSPRTDAPPTTAPKAERQADASIRISQQSLEVLTATVTSLMQRARRREIEALRRRELAKELVHLHRLAEDLGPAAVELAQRLGAVKEQVGEGNRANSLINTEELRDLSVISEEVQALRMLPIGVLFESYPRMVRELAKELGRDVELLVQGEDEKIDRSVLDAMREPLLHLVRNAIDHGLERPDERLAANKSAKGTLKLEVSRDGDRLVLRVSDDGRGIDPATLRAVAVKRGLLDEAAAAALDDAASVDLIFLSGFSSRDTVTDVSGRGLGLDVVRTKLVQIGGEVTIRSNPGRGTTFELRVPLSLTVAPVLFVQAGDDRLCLAAANVERALQVESGHLRQIAGRPALHVGDQVLPFASIASILGAAPERAATEGELVLIVRGRGQHAAIAVDRVLEERVQAILPLRGMLSRFAHLSGATSLADGSIALVLSAVHLVSAASGHAGRLSAPLERRAETRRHRILVVDDSPLTRELLVSLLESVGYDITQAVDGQQAMERLGRESFDLVVTDLEMPVVDGLELTKRVKTHPTLRALPVVIVTTRGSDADRRRGMDAGADGYVTKGDLVRQDLVDVVGRLLA